MAQIGQNGLFRKLLPRCNIGSIGVPATQHGLKTPAKAGVFFVNLKRLNLRNLGLWSCNSPAPTISGRAGKDTRVKLKCMLAKFAADESGATAIEYGLIAAAIALAIIEIIYALGTNLVAKLQSLATALK